MSLALERRSTVRGGTAPTNSLAIESMHTQTNQSEMPRYLLFSDISSEHPICQISDEDQASNTNTESPANDSRDTNNAETTALESAAGTRLISENTTESRRNDSVENMTDNVRNREETAGTGLIDSSLQSGNANERMIRLSVTDAEINDSGIEEFVSTIKDESGPIYLRHQSIPLLPDINQHYSGPVSLADTVIKLTPPEGSGTPDPSDVESVTHARADFDQIVSLAVNNHAEISAFVRNEMDALRNRYRTLEHQADSFMKPCDEVLDTCCADAQRMIDDSLEDALDALTTAKNSAVFKVYGAASWGRQQVSNNANTAGTQVVSIINQLSSNYTAILTDIADEITYSGTQAIASVRNFISTGALDYSDDGSEIEDASQEARRQAIPGLTREEAVINSISERQSTTYRNAIHGVRDQFKASEFGKALEKRKNEINTEGSKAIDKAVGQATRSLQDQFRDARKTIRRIAAESKAQIVNMHQASRARIKGQGQALLDSGAMEVNQGLKGLHIAARLGLPAFENVVTRTEKTLERAGENGPHPLADAARNAVTETPRTIVEIARAQQERLGLSMKGTELSLNEKQKQTHTAIDNDCNTTRIQQEHYRDESTKNLLDVTENYGKAFGQVADEVGKASEQWAMPLAKHFKQAIDTTIKQQVNATGEGSFNQWMSERFQEKERFLNDALRPFNNPGTNFRVYLDNAAQSVQRNLDGRVGQLESAFNYGVLDRTNEAGVTGALRGLTFNQGRAVRAKFLQSNGRYSLDEMINSRLDGNDKSAALSYLAGNTTAGVAAELRASIHWYNDEESRIEAAMRSLTPAELENLKRSSDGSQALDTVRSNLDGTDLNVFNALEQGNHAQADAYRMLDSINDARQRGDNDALNTVLSEYSRASSDRGWEANADTRRNEVQQQLAQMLVLRGSVNAVNENGVSRDNATIVEGYVLRPIEVQYSTGDGPPVSVTLTVDGANRDLATALIRHGEGSVDARAAHLGVEMQRQEGPNVLNIDTALVDPRLNPDYHASPDERQTALRERNEVFERFARQYGGQNQSGADQSAREITEARLRTAFGNDRLGADLTSRLVNEEHPSPRTAAMAMMHAAKGWGTNEELMFRFTERMNRVEIDKMRLEYTDLRTEYPGSGSSGNLDRDLGTFSYSSRQNFGELSGDDRLRMERALRGQPRNDRERAEAAAFAAQQQRNETGFLGSFLASGSLADLSLTNNINRLENATGGQVTFDATGRAIWHDSNGRLLPDGPPNFDSNGRYNGANSTEFHSASTMTQSAAENYAATIDHYANFAATTVAVLGAVAAAVATVLTGGAASPLLMASIAGISGLAAMGMRAAISGGRYGWEQAATDLGTTAVQALTAGVGQHLALVSRGGTQTFMAGMRTFRSVNQATLGQMGRITGSTFGDMVLMGAATGGLGALGNNALSEETWQKGFGHGIERLLEAAMTGILSGAATSIVSNSFEAIPFGKVVQGGRPNIGEIMGNSTNPFVRGGLRGVSSALGGFAGREVELNIERASGRFKGDSGDIFTGSLEAAGQAAVQDTIGGAVESRVQARMNRLEEARVRAAEQQHQTGSENGAAHHPHTDGNELVPHVQSDTPHASDVQSGISVPHASETAAPSVRQNFDVNLHNEAPGALHISAIEPGADGGTSPLRLHGVGADSEAHIQPATREEFSQGTAAGIHDSDFHGRSVAPGSSEAADNRTLKGSIRRLVALGTEIPNARLPDPHDPARVVIRAHSGEEVTVRIRISDGPLPPIDGISPAAHFTRNPNSGEYIIEVSPGTPARHVERALAHELAEIQAGHGRSLQGDLLNPQSRPGPIDDSSPQSRLSAHDQGRLAELGVISRRMETAKTAAERGRLQADADTLITHLGLAGSTHAADERRAIAARALEHQPEALNLLINVALEHNAGLHAFAEIVEQRRMSAGSGLVDSEMLDLPGAPAMGRRRGDSRFDRSEIGQTRADATRIKDHLRALAREDFGRIMQAALLDPGQHSHLTLKTLEYLTPAQIEYVVRRGEMPPGFEFHHLMAVADYPEFAHRGDVGLSLPSDVHKQAAHGGDTTRPLEANTFIDPGAETRPAFHDDPEAVKGNRALHSEIASGTRTTGNVDRDLLIEQRAVLNSMNHESTLLQKTIDRMTTAVNRARESGTAVPRLEARLQKAREQLGLLQQSISYYSNKVKELQSSISQPSPAAAEIPGSEMRLADHVIIRDHDAALTRALPEALAAVGTHQNGVLRHEIIPGGAVVTVRRADGSSVDVHIIVGETRNGNIASFPDRPGPDGRYTVTLSDRAPESTHARALAHELEEIRYHDLQAHAGAEDALRSGASPPDKSTRLSAHDRGRLAELDVLKSRLERARLENPPNTVNIARIEHEAQKLVSHLGLANSHEAGVRRDLVRRILESDLPTGRSRNMDDNVMQSVTDESSGAQQAQHRSFINFINDTADAASANPLLKPRPSRLEEFAVLAGQINHARMLGDSELADQLFAQARSLIRDHGAGVTGALGNQPLVNQRKFRYPDGSEELRFSINSDTQQKLTDLAVLHAMDPPAQKNVQVLMDDICARELARARAFGADEYAGNLAVQRDQKYARITEIEKNLSGLQGEIGLNQHRLTSTNESPDILKQRAAELDSRAKRIRKNNPEEARALNAEAAQLRVRAFSNEPLSDRQTAGLSALVKNQIEQSNNLQAELQSLRQELPGLEMNITEAVTRAAAFQGDAERPSGVPSPGIPVEPQAPGMLRNAMPETEHLSPRHDHEQQEIVNQRFGDAPDFQQFHTLLELYYERYPDKRRLPYEERVSFEKNLFNEWSRGKYFDSTTGELRTLGNLPFIAAPQAKETVIGHLTPDEQFAIPSTSRPVHEQDADQVIDSINKFQKQPLSHGQEQQLRSILTDAEMQPSKLTVSEGEALSKALTSVRDNLIQLHENAPLADQVLIGDRLDSVNTAIRDLREALGVAAGRKAAQEMPELRAHAELMEGQGRDTVDLVFGERQNGPLFVLECKGRTQAGRGDRIAQSENGTLVRAQQGTREYLMSVSQAMQGAGKNGKTREVGAAIQRGLVTSVPEIRYFIVRQEFNRDGTLGAIKYIEYSMERN